MSRVIILLGSTHKILPNLAEILRIIARDGRTDSSWSRNTLSISTVVNRFHYALLSSYYKNGEVMIVVK